MGAMGRRNASCRQCKLSGEYVYITKSGLCTTCGTVNQSFYNSRLIAEAAQRSAQRKQDERRAKSWLTSTATSSPTRTRRTPR